MQLFHLSISEDIDNQISGCQKISSTQCSPSAWAAAAKWKTTFFFTPILPWQRRNKGYFRSCCQLHSGFVHVIWGMHSWQVRIWWNVLEKYRENMGKYMVLNTFKAAAIWYVPYQLVTRTYDKWRGKHSSETWPAVHYASTDFSDSSHVTKPCNAIYCCWHTSYIVHFNNVLYAHVSSNMNTRRICCCNFYSYAEVLCMCSSLDLSIQRTNKLLLHPSYSASTIIVLFSVDQYNISPQLAPVFFRKI